jgi:hypothetical protein
MNRWPGRRTQCGAAAVEAVLLSGFVLVPLLLGVILYGHWFWQAQRIEPLASRLPVAGVSGTFTCEELVDEVRTVVLNTLSSSSLGIPVAAEAIVVEVVEVLPTVGAHVHVSIGVPASEQLGGFVPLPNSGLLVSEASYRLNDVVVTTSSCR